MALRMILAFSFFVSAGFAQKPEFEAASVKAVPESVGYPPRAGYWVSPGMENPQRFHALSPAASLIEWAYSVRNFQILGGPEWMREARARIEVQGTTDHPVSRAEMRQMLQTLLAERFHLKFHREMKEIPVYALVVGKNGSKLTEVEDPSSNPDRGGGIDVGNGTFRGSRVTMEQFIGVMSENLDRPVIDQTNLTGRYNFEIHFDQSQLVDWRMGPALFSMVQDVGLKLEPRKMPVEMLVVDSVEQPTQN